MFLKCSVRKKDGKERRSWSIVESRRVNRRRTVHRHVLYLGERSDSQHRSWQKAIGVFDESTGTEQQMFLFPEDRLPPLDGDVDALLLRVSALRLEHPRPWGACWLANRLWQQLHLNSFFEERLGGSREGTDWAMVLRILTIYRVLSPGSEWRLHREWFERTALADLLAVDVRAAQDDTLYRARDRLLEHREALFARLRQSVADLFHVRYEVLLYDLTSIPTEEVLAEMRWSTPPVQYLVGTPKGRLTRLEPALAEKPWRSAREKVRVKLHAEEGELYVLAESAPRKDKERAMRQRKLKRYWKRLGELKRQLADRPMSRDDLLEKIGVAKDRAGRQAAALVEVKVAAAKPWSGPTSDPSVSGNPTGRGRRKKPAPKQNSDPIGAEALSYHLDKTKLHHVRIREGCYLLRANMTGGDPDELWRYYMQLVAVEEAFRTLKGDLGLRPIFHQKPGRIEAHLFIAFFNSCEALPED